MQYRGSCHCGKVRISFAGDFKEAISCNCSICARRGSLLWFAPRETVTLTTPEAAAATYLFNSHTIRHRFCPNCGIHVFGEGENEGKAMAAINLRCVEGLDVDAIPVRHVDGRSFPTIDAQA